jgi:hypothetical protein
MLTKFLTVLLVSGVLSSCIHTPSYYAALKKVTYTNGDARFSDNTLYDKTKYGSLVLREDGACSITETRDGRIYRGGGAWNETDHKNIISIGLSSNSAMSIYHFYVRLYKETNSYIVSDKLEMLVEL